MEGDSAVAGYTWTQEKRIEIFVRPGDGSDDLARVLAHELGHAVDVTFNSGDDRRRWLRSRQASEVQWWPDSGAPDFDSGAGDFAESFAWWQLQPIEFRSTLGSAPNEAQLKLLADLAQG